MEILPRLDLWKDLTYALQHMIDNVFLLLILIDGWKTIVPPEEIYKLYEKTFHKLFYSIVMPAYVIQRNSGKSFSFLCGSRESAAD